MSFQIIYDMETIVLTTTKRSLEKEALIDQNMQLSNQKNSFEFVSIPIGKTNYQLLVWGLIILLTGALSFFILRFKNSISVIKKTKSKLHKLENDFEGFRKKSLKKEQEIMRKLQDEINKNLL